MISVYITCRDMKEARIVAKHLLDKKLIACANMFPIESMFHWKGNLIDEKEVAMLCKTQKKNFESIQEAVKEVHSYDLPCVVAFDLAGISKGFSKWVISVT